MDTIKEKMRQKITAYYTDPVTGKGKGIAKVAKQVGVTDQQLRDIASGRVHVTLDTLLAFSAAYPGELTDIITEAFGIASVNAQQTQETPFSETAEEIISKLTNEIERWSTRYDKLESRFDNTQSRYQHLNDQVIREKAPEYSFHKTGSQITVYAAPRNLIGFGREAQQIDGTVRIHPAMAQNQFVLDSRQTVDAQQG